MHLTIDFETRSRAPLKECGHYKYAEDPSTDIMVLAIKADELPPVVWLPKKFIHLYSIPSELLTDDELTEIIHGAETIEAHNAGFERMLWRWIMHKRYGFADLPLEQMRCSASKAASFALPRDLSRACKAMGLSQQKDETGYKVMMKMCKPRTPTASNPKEWNEDPADFEILVRYCKQDVEAEHALSQALYDLSPKEQKLWELDQIINDRGIPIDVEGCKNLIAKLQEKEARLLLEVQEITGGEVTSVRQIARTISWLGSKGVELEDLTKSTVAGAMPGMDALPKRLLEIRQELGKSSVSKLETMLAWACADGRARGVHMFWGANTGRWSGKGPQTQNLPRDSYGPSDVDAVLDCDLATTELLYDNMHFTASKCVRGMLKAEPGKEFLVADFSSIEARILAWLAGEEKKLEAFFAGKCVYSLSASAIYKVPFESIGKKSSERQVGKVCIAEGQLVLTDHGLVPIEAVALNDKVWDGVEFVSHSGVLFNGVKEVIEYDGLTATPDHIVYVANGSTSCELREAKTLRSPLTTTGNGRNPIGLVENNIYRNEEGKTLDEVHPMPVRGVRENGVGELLQFETGDNERLPALFSTKASTRVAAKKSHRNEGTLHEREGPWVEKLRRARDTLQFYFGHRRRGVDTGNPGAGPSERVGPDKQRRSLRDWKLALRNPKRKREEYKSVKSLDSGFSVGEYGKPLLNFYDSPNAESGKNPERNIGFSEASSPGQTEKLAGDRTPVKTARVYDLINAGPRRRFTVSGKLVSNCELALGYQGWLGAFQSMAKTYGVVIPDEEAEEIIKAWRKANPRIVKYWAAIELAALQAVKTGQVFSVGRIKFGMRDGFLQCRLPSGRLLAYSNAAPATVKTKYGITKEVISYMGVDSKTGAWCRQFTYGGSLTENIVQGVARDLLAEAMTRAEKAGMHVIMHVHDEAVIEMKKGSTELKEFERLLSVTPDWAKGCPIGAEGFKDYRYRK